MRKFVVAGTLAALGVAILAVPASASFDHHFSVISKHGSVHQLAPNAIRIKAKLVDPRDRHNRVGRAWLKCTFGARKGRCRGHVRLNGEIGGFGNISVSGDFGGHDQRLNVTGGTHDFNAVAGKMLSHNRRSGGARLRFDLVR
jgi:hypothetical protein